MVAEIIERNRDGIAMWCRKHRVRALWGFGSTGATAEVTSAPVQEETIDEDTKHLPDTRPLRWRRTLPQGKGQ